MSNCVFCNLGLLNKVQVLEANKDYVLMLSSNPQTKGHMLVVPGIHASALKELEKDMVGLLFAKAIEYGEVLMKKLEAKAYIIKVNNKLYELEKGEGHISHIHIHIIPRYRADEILSTRPKNASIASLKEIRENLYRQPNSVTL